MNTKFASTLLTFILGSGLVISAPASANISSVALLADQCSSADWYRYNGKIGYVNADYVNYRPRY